jgi:ATP-dependent helicase HepA
MENILNQLLHKTAVCLAKYLERVLPSLFEDWWKQAVVNNLSFQQRRRLEQLNISSLAALDLAALLRVLDQNWYQISTRLNITSEARHFVKEMQTVRNRWAHATMEGFPVEDVYRDLDTLQRFCAIIKADEILLQEIRTTKTAILDKEKHFSGQGETIEQKPLQNTKERGAEFEPGQIVSLKSNPAILGAVVSVLPGKPENRFKVFVDGETQTYYASQLQAEDLGADDSQFFPCEQFHSYLTALQIRYPGLSTLYSLNAARVDFILRIVDLISLLKGYCEIGWGLRR